MLKKRNLERRAERDAVNTREKADPIWGHAPGNTAQWEQSDLAKIIVSPDIMYDGLRGMSTDADGLDSSSIPSSTSSGSSPSAELPSELAFGVGPPEKQLLFEALPELAKQHPFLTVDIRSAAHQQELQDRVEKVASMSIAQFSKIVDLRNASAAGIAFENRKRCVEAFGDPATPGDSGRPEVQGECSYPFIFGSRIESFLVENKFRQRATPTHQSIVMFQNEL